MNLVHHVAQVAATLAAMAQTRLALAAVEMEEESLRFLSYLALAMLALLCLFVGLVLLVFLVIVVFWDTHRIAAIAITAAVFIAAALATLLGVRASFRSKPKLLSFTLAELNKDLDQLQHLARRGTEQP
ncbi:MAG: phage holin family protein [Janthinobacterium sp.]